MSLQLLDIVLYSVACQRRVLSFRPGALNIITGDSKTGKSALIDILDYCLGSKACMVPDGVIRNTVAWYAVRLTDGRAEHFVARRAPDPDRGTTTDADYRVGSPIDIPEAGALGVTTNIESVVERLGAVIGIGLNQHEPPVGQTRAPLTATLRHALAFVFQTQNEISQRALLFHQQSEPFVPQAIKDTLPYFLGAVPEGAVAARLRLKELRRELRSREQSLAQASALAGRGVGAAAGLLAEARNAGLLPADLAPESFDAAVEALRQATREAPAGQVTRAEEQPDSAEFDRLQEQYAELRHRLQRETDQLNAMHALRADEGGFTHESREQVSRLASLRLFTDDGEAHCPLCGQAVDEQLPAIEELDAEIKQANAQLRRVERHTPRLGNRSAPSI